MELMEAPARDILGLSEDFVAEANSVIFFKLVRSAEGLRSDEDDFNPSFTHQFFGDDEKIYGYKKLEICIHYSAARLNIYIGVNYDEVAPVCSPENLLKTISDKIETKYLTNLDEFEKLLVSEKSFRPYGDMLKSFKFPDNEGDSVNTTYEIYHCTAQTPGWPEYHARLQTFLLWFIDAASYIEMDDNWQFFVMFEKYISLETNEQMYAIVGFTTVYEYYAYPANIRPRISQMLILPPFQRKGLGRMLLNAIYEHYSTIKKVLDITVEDPSEEFQAMRDFVDCINCKKLPSFAKDKLKEGYSDDMANEARERFKINKKQGRRVYEILRLYYTNRHDNDDFTGYRLNVKKRLNSLFQRDMVMKVLANGEGSSEGDNQDKKHKLHVLFEALLEEYSAIVSKLNESERLPVNGASSIK